MPPHQRFPGQKSARSTDDNKEGLSPNKKLPCSTILDDADQKPKCTEQRKRKKSSEWFNKDSDAEILNLLDFEYIWRSRVKTTDDDEVNRLDVM